MNRHDKTCQNFLTRPDPKNTCPELDIFDPKQNGLAHDPTHFLRVNTTRPVSRPDPNHFLNFFFWVKKKKINKIKTILV